MKTKTALIFIFLLVPFSLKFFDASFLSSTFLNYSFMFMIWITIFLSIPHLFHSKSIFSIPIYFIFFSILFSMVMAFFSWDQNFFHSFVETTQYLIWPLFFFMRFHNISIRNIERIILFYGVVYALLFFIQYLNQGVVLFGRPLYGDEWTEDRGVIRIIFPGAGIFILSLFISINKLTSSKDFRWFWILFSLLGIIIPVMQVTRQFIVGVLLIYFFHLLKYVSIPKKVGLIFLFIVGLGFAINSNIPMVEGVIEAQERDSGLGKKYIRVLAGEYFLTDYSPNEISAIFGNGAPYWGLSSYGKFNEKLGDERGFYLSDVGLIAVYAMFGIFSIIGFISIWIISFLVPIPEEYQYAKYYLWYILFTSFTWYSVYHYHYLISTVFALYVFQKGLDSTKRRNKINKILKSLLKKKDLKTEVSFN